MSGNGKWVRVVDPATGESKAVSPEEAQQGFVGGQLDLPAGQDVDLVHHDGTVASYSPDKVSGAINAGWRFADRKSVATADAQNNQLRAGVEGALSGLTFGLSDVAMKEAGVDSADLAARRDTTGGSMGYGTGMVAGLLGPGLLGKAVGGVGKAVLGTALAPQLAVDAAGAAVEAAAEKGLATVLSSQAARGAVAAGLGRATEGAVYGMGGMLSEAALGNADANGENMLASAGMGALIGAVPGAAVGGLRGFFSGRATARAALPNTAAEFAAGARASGLDIPDSAAKKWWPRLKDAAVKGGELGGYNPEDIAKLHTPQARAVLRDLQGAMDSNARDFHAAISDVAKNQDEARKVVFNDLRPAYLSEALPKGAQASVLGRVSDDVGSMRGALDGIKKDWAELGFRSPASAEGAVRMYEGQLDNLEDKLFKHLGQAPTEIDPVAGRVRRSLGDAVNTAGQIPEEAVRDAFVGLNKIAGRLDEAGKGVDEFNDVIGNRFAQARDALRSGLEDAGVWGRAADEQASLRRAFEARQSAWDRLRKVGVAGADGEITAASVQRYVNAMDRVRGDDAVDALAAWRTADASWNEAAHNVYPSSGLLQRAAVVHGKLDKVVGELEQNVGVNSALRNLRARKEMAYGLEASGGLASAGGIIGGVSGGLPGAMVGYGLGKVGQMIMDPARFAVVASNMAHRVEQMNGWLETRAARLAGLKDKLGPSLPAGRVISRATLAMTSGSEADRQQAYEDRVGEIQTAMNPQAFAASATHAMGDLPDHLPDHTAAMSRTAQLAAAVLAQNLPRAQPGTAGTGADAIHGRPRPSRADLLRFAQIDGAVQDPTAVLDRLSAGKPVYPHELQALDQVFPAMMERFRQSVVYRMAEADKPPSGQTRRNLEMVLGKDVPTSVYAARQRVHEQPPAPGPVPGRRPRASGVGNPAVIASAGQNLDSYPNLPSQ